MAITVRASIAGSGRKVHSRESIIEALREYARRYGQPTTAAFNPSTAKWRDDQLSVDRYYAGREDGSAWPSLNAIKSYFNGHFNEALEAAGLPPNLPGPSSRKRAVGKHAPSLAIREHRIFVSDARLDEAVTRRNQAEARAVDARARVVVLTEQLAKVRAENRELARAAARTPRERVITKTTIKTDGRAARAAERAGKKLDEAVAALRATQDQLRAYERALAAKSRALEASAAEAVRNAESRAQVERERDRAVDRLAAVTAALEQAREDLGGARAKTPDVMTSDMVRQAQLRADAAEMRAARAEREMAEQAVAITGERRKLTAEEMAGLRRSGPAGPQVLAEALGKVAQARKGRADLGLALNELASAALSWKDRL